MGPSKLFRTALLLVALLVVKTSLSAQPALPVIHVNIVPGDDNTPLVYAVQSGMFTKAGLDVEIVPGTGGATIAAAVVSGTYEIGNSSLLAILNAHLHGVPLALIGAQGLDNMQNPYEQFVVATSSSYRTVKDLNGATIGEPSLNDIAQLGVMTWVDRNGGDSKSLHFVELPQSAAPAAITGNRVAGSVIRQPQLAQMLASGTFRTLSPAVYSAFGPEFVVAGFFTTREYSATHSDVIRTFMQTMYRAAAYTNTHHAETVQMMAAYTKVPAETIQHMERVRAPTELRLGDIQPVIDAAAKYGFIQHAFPASELL